jgi:hypothetical protein
VTPTLHELVAKKRPMFAYEREVRLVQSEFRDDESPDQDTLGIPLHWEPEDNLECIRIHSEADYSFFKTVIGIVERYAPPLKGCAEWSAMREGPPF